MAVVRLKNLKNKLRGFNILTYIIPDGEKYKNIKTLYKIQDFLVRNLQLLSSNEKRKMEDVASENHEN